MTELERRLFGDPHLTAEERDELRSIVEQTATTPRGAALLIARLGLDRPSDSTTDGGE